MASSNANEQFPHQRTRNCKHRTSTHKETATFRNIGGSLRGFAHMLMHFDALDAERCVAERASSMWEALFHSEQIRVATSQVGSSSASAPACPTWKICSPNLESTAKSKKQLLPATPYVHMGLHQRCCLLLGKYALWIQNPEQEKKKKSFFQLPHSTHEPFTRVYPTRQTRSLDLEIESITHVNPPKMPLLHAGWVRAGPVLNFQGARAKQKK